MAFHAPGTIYESSLGPDVHYPPIMSVQLQKTAMGLTGAEQDHSGQRGEVRGISYSGVIAVFYLILYPPISPTSSTVYGRSTNRYSSSSWACQSGSMQNPPRPMMPTSAPLNVGLETCRLALIGKLRKPTGSIASAAGLFVSYIAGRRNQIGGMKSLLPHWVPWPLRKKLPQQSLFCSIGNH